MFHSGELRCASADDSSPIRLQTINQTRMAEPEPVVCCSVFALLSAVVEHTVKQITPVQESQLIQESNRVQRIASISVFSDLAFPPRSWQKSTDCSKDPQLSPSIFPPHYIFSLSFFLSNYRLSNLCFLVNAPQSVSAGLSGIGINPRDGVSKRLRAHHNPKSPVNPEHYSVFLKRIVFHPCHCSKSALLKWWLTSMVQRERSIVR